MSTSQQPAVPPRNVPVVIPPVVPVPEPRSQPDVSGVDVEDLIHLPGPLTEDAVMKCLQARFNASQYYVSYISS